MITTKKRLMTADGQVMKATELWGFFATIRNQDGTYVAQEDGKNPLKDIKLDGYYMGASKDAREVAQAHEKQLIEHYPDKKIQVRAVALEKVGPIVQHQMNGLIADSQLESLVQYTLAEELAKYKSREKLEINPDRGALVQELVVEARKTVQQKLIAARAKMKGQEGSGLVGPDGETPISSESVLGAGDEGGPFNPAVAAQASAPGPVLVTA